MLANQKETHYTVFVHKSDYYPCPDCIGADLIGQSQCLALGFLVLWLFYLL